MNNKDYLDQVGLFYSHLLFFLQVSGFHFRTDNFLIVARQPRVLNYRPLLRVACPTHRRARVGDKTSWQKYLQKEVDTIKYTQAI